MTSQQPIVVKIGTNVITKSDGTPNHHVLTSLIQELSSLVHEHYRLVVVSSGAMGFGRALVRHREGSPIDSVRERQLLAATGQVALMRAYAMQFEAAAITVAQVLATKQDFLDRTHYLNMRRCFETILEHGVVPIVNENDAVSVSELMFTDNDELAGLVATMLNAERLIIVTNVDGVMTGDPLDPASRLIRSISPTDRIALTALTGPSQFGRGGMRSKVLLARRLAKLGIQVHIVNGSTPQVLNRVIQNQPIGTVIVPSRRPSSVKRWLEFSESLAEATAVMNDCLVARLADEASLNILPIGITRVEGSAAKGDVVRLVDERGDLIGVGRAEYGTDQLTATLGQSHQKPFIRSQYLVLYPA